MSALKPKPESYLSSSTSTDLHSTHLRSYSRAKFAVAARLRELRETLKKCGNKSRFTRSEALIKKIADDRFKLAVVGQIGRGKSSLINAIVGRELLPTGLQPLSSTITVLKFGPTERLIIRYTGLQLHEILPVCALADYVTAVTQGITEGSLPPRSKSHCHSSGPDLCLLIHQESVRKLKRKPRIDTPSCQNATLCCS